MEFNIVMTINWQISVHTYLNICYVLHNPAREHLLHVFLKLRSISWIIFGNEQADSGTVMLPQSDTSYKERTNFIFLNLMTRLAEGMYDSYLPVGNY